ncbi:Smr/MutS family protein [Desulfovibrio inopinatus]|uniref:Smr/MutS family protein n=1 Tax=Desulfovibrio inopinatus TaxID=102109 RepID=UPI0004186D9C|nr:Smr/MutS family protein [Desulfovibrio inopinatus]
MSKKNKNAFTNNPFHELKGIKVKKKAKKPVVQAPPEPEKAAVPHDEDHLFFRAMTGVDPMDTNKKGRQVAGLDAAPPVPPSLAKADEDAQVRESLADLINGKVEFELAFTDEFVQGYIKGIDSKIVRQLRAGRFSPEAHLDLHGLNADQAKAAILHFLREHYMLGRRCLLLIPGRGVNSPGGISILKEEVKSWLTRDPLRRIVLAFCTALPKHGGAGALYVLLRKQKKVGGKVVWEKHWDSFS